MYEVQCSESDEVKYRWETSPQEVDRRTQASSEHDEPGSWHDTKQRLDTSAQTSLTPTIYPSWTCTCMRAITINLYYINTIITPYPSVYS